ncbi:MAG TPA: deaminase [Burkholderiaceae bacterium]|jgi:dCMP deaminase
MDVEQLVELAVAAANKSPGRPRKVGAVLVLADQQTTLTACNDFPAGVRDLESRHADPQRLLWIEHAERNALFAAARAGHSTAGATLVATFHPCAECARAIVQSGVASLFTLPPDFSDPVWGPGFQYSSAILEEGGVRVTYLAHDPVAMHARTMGQAGAT